MATLVDIIRGSSLKERLQLCSVNIEKSAEGYKARLNFRFLESREVMIDPSIDLKTQYRELAESRILEAVQVLMPIENGSSVGRKSAGNHRGPRMRRQAG